MRGDNGRALTISSPIRMILFGEREFYIELEMIDNESIHLQRNHDSIISHEKHMQTWYITRANVV